MIYQTYVTFLNAFTFTNATEYPVTSLSEDQLLATVDYILNGVFHPLVLTDERAFMREGYRYELASPDGEVTLNGTVYNEMKGSQDAISQAMLSSFKILFPGSSTANYSGGDPDIIPQLTLQELRDFHQTYYHPSNAVFALYGAIHLEQMLSQLDAFISSYEKIEVVFPRDGFDIVKGHLEETVLYPTDQFSSATPLYSYTLPLPNATQEEILLSSMMWSGMMNEGQALGRRLKERLPHITPYIASEQSQPQPLLMLVFINATEDDGPVLQQIIDEAFAEIRENGLDHQLLRNNCIQAAYQKLDTSLSSSFAEAFLMEMGSIRSNLLPLDSYRTSFDLFPSLMDKLDSGFVEATFEKFFVNPETSLFLTLLPQKGAVEESQAKLEQELKDLKASMTPEEIDALVARTQDFAKWLEENAKNNQIDLMKAVKVRDLPEIVPHYTATERTEGDLRVIESDLDLGDMVEVGFYWDASCVPVEDLPAYMLAYILLGSLPTEMSTVDELEVKASANSYQFAFQPVVPTLEDQVSYHPYLKASFRTTKDDMEAAFELLDEIIFSTQWQDEEALHYFLNRITNVIRYNIDSEPLGTASELVKAMSSDTGRYLYEGSNIVLYPYCQKLLSLSGDELQAEVARLKNALRYVFTQSNTLFTCVGNEDLRKQTVTLAKQLYDKLPSDEYETVDYVAQLPSVAKHTAIAVNSTVQYNFQALSLDKTDVEKSSQAKLHVLAGIVGDELLSQLRFQGGAYGAYANFSYPEMYVYTYRDPSLKETYNTFREIGQSTRDNPPTMETLEGPISSMFSKIAMSYSPLSGAWQAIEDVLCQKNTFVHYEQLLRDMKTTTPEDMIALTHELDLLGEEGYRITVGSLTAIEANSDLFDEVNTMFVE